jgi:hypothetical protein
VGFAQGQIAKTLAWQLGRHLGYGPLEPVQLAQRLASAPRPVLLVVTDLHRAGRGPAHLAASSPCATVSDLTTPLLQLPNVRMVIESDTSSLAGAQEALVLDLGHTAGPDESGVPLPAQSSEGQRPASQPAAAGRDWRTAVPEEREHALDRALTTGTASELLTDPGYLALASVPAITATLADHTVPAPKRLRAIWAQAAPALSAPSLADTERAALLHAAAVGRDPRLAEYLRPLAESGSWATRWSEPGNVARKLRPGDSAEQGCPEEGFAEAGGLGWFVVHTAQFYLRQVGEDPAQGLRRVGEATKEAGLAIEVGVGEFGPHIAGREAGEGEKAAGRESLVEEGEVADAAVRRQMVETAGVVDQVVRAAEFGADDGEGVTTAEPDLGSCLPGAVLGPGDGRRGEVDGIHLEAQRGEVECVSAWAAAQVEGATRRNQAVVKV